MTTESYWLRQDKEPLFPDLLWSKPENKQQAGKLLIIGGNIHGIQAPAQAYSAAQSAGIGVARVLLPSSVSKSIGNTFEGIIYSMSNKSGGFSAQSLSDWLDNGQWADCVVLAGDTARNSETAMVTEKFIEKYSGQLCITQDCLDQFINSPLKLFNRPKTTLVASFGQLQKMWSQLDMQEVLLQRNGIPKNIKIIHDLTARYPANIVIKQNDQIIVAVGGKVSTTTNREDVWRVVTAAKIAVWWLQNPNKVFEALTTALIN
jgi:NAD(P)H-hydrate repair Nnr-like enzyme with NAD(P)H-hydrate dehydratase domain